MRVGLLLLCALLAGCGPVLPLVGASERYVIEAGDLDGPDVNKASELVSQGFPNPTEAQKKTPVAITVHGYSASTYEMSAMAQYLRDKGHLVSNVLLGGHGRDLADFEASTWREWGQPIVEEYDRLKALGFENVSIVATSTGGALTLHHMAAGRLAPRRLALVAPLVYFRDKRAGYIGLFEMMGARAQVTNPKQNAKGNWYRNRPIATLKSLVELTEIVKDELRSGIIVPATTKVWILQSDGDPTVDPKSAPLVRDGLKGDVTLEMLSSVQHVPIRPLHVDRDWTADEVAMQQDLLNRIERFVAQ